MIVREDGYRAKVVADGTPYQCVLALLPLCTADELDQLKLSGIRRAQQQRSEARTGELVRGREQLGLPPLKLIPIEWPEVPDGTAS